MRGCNPIGDFCNCNCHVTGIRFLLMSNPPKPCCSCNNAGLDYIQVVEEQDVSPMVKQIQELEKELKEVKETVNSIDGDMNFVSTFESIRILEARLKEISDWMIEKQELFRYLDERIEKLEARTLLMVDVAEDMRQWKWVHEQISRLDLVISSIESKSNITIMNDLLQRIEKLETHKNYQIDENRKISRHFDEIEEITKRITEDDMKAGRRPHKCPVCEGYGMVKVSSICPACEGKGIIWG